MKECIKGQRLNVRKIPGMIYLLVSFIPWITYWSLCGVIDKLGIIVSFAISLILVVKMFYWKGFNLMDLTSLLYLTIALAFTFILNSNIFIERRIFLGYFTLSLMALLSLLIGQPFSALRFVLGFRRSVHYGFP